MPRISVIIPVFNVAPTVDATLKSALAQSFDDFEVIVVNDGSTDTTAAVLEGYAGRIRVLNQENRGPAAARNAGVRVSSGEYLAFLDADDLWQPEMLAGTVQELSAAPDCALVYGDLAVIDGSGRELSASLVGRKKAHAPTLDEMLGKLWPIMPSATLIRRAVFERCGGFCERFRIARFEDYSFFLRARELGDFRFLPRRLGSWRFTGAPKPPNRAPGGENYAQIFASLVEQRYGVSAKPLLSSWRRAARSSFSRAALLALASGDRGGARTALVKALRLDPRYVKTYLRLLKTLMPLSWLPFVSGRTAAGAPRPKPAAGTPRPA